jgi:hypothetical protein
MSQWFVPPIVVPLFLVFLLSAFLSYRWYARSPSTLR